MSTQVNQIVADGIKHNKKALETHQWVENVRAWSTEYDTGNWSHHSLAGPPRVYPVHSDDCLAWAPKSSGGLEYLELVFATEVRPTRIEIYETYYPGALTTISCLPIKDGVEDTQWFQVYSGPIPVYDQNCQNSRICSIEIPVWIYFF
jgi:hypothetical protein